jgi:hypothetical protein
MLLLLAFGTRDLLLVFLIGLGATPGGNGAVLRWIGELAFNGSPNWSNDFFLLSRLEQKSNTPWEGDIWTGGEAWWPRGRTEMTVVLSLRLCTRSRLP